MSSGKLSLHEWQQAVPDLPPLLDLLAHDLYVEGRAPGNAVAEAYRTLREVAKKGRTQHGSRVPFRTQHAARDSCIEWDAMEFMAGAIGAFPLDAKLAQKLDEAAGSMAKATIHEPVGKPGGPGLWHHKGMQLPAYIQHIANDLREKRGMTTSRAIATAVAAVKRWAAGGGKVDPETRAAAAKAVAEWEALKAEAKARRGAKAAKEAQFVNAVSKLKHISKPMPDQASFATRYGNRLLVIEGLLGPLRDKQPLAIKHTRDLLEASDADVEELIELLLARKHLSMVLMEALGYNTRPVRARTAEKHRGRYHGMHGVQKAVRTRALLPDEEEQEEAAAVAAGNGDLREAAPPPAAATAHSTGTWNADLHPRGQGGKFGSKGGAAQPAGAAAQQHPPSLGATPTPAPGAQAQSLAAAIQMADPEFRKNMAATAKWAKAHPAALHPGRKAAMAQAQLAGDQLQNIGYGTDPASIKQFQQDEGLAVTGKMDPATQRTIANVYASNLHYSASRFPDVTGIKGFAKVTTRSSGTPAPAGRSTKGRTSQKRVREATIVGSSPGADPAATSKGQPWYGPGSVLFAEAPVRAIPPGHHHANTGPEGGDEILQPGGDDLQFQNPPEMPPNLREHEGVNACATCVHFSKKGWLTESHVSGGCMAHTWPVHRLETCDDWATLTPPDAPLKVYEARLAEAEDSRRGSEIVAARAALKAARAIHGEVVELDFHPASQWLMEALYALRIEERDIGIEKRKALAKKGHTLKGGTSYPIESLGDLSNAIQAWGRAKPADRPALKRLLLKMARKLKASAETVARIRALSVTPVQEADSKVDTDVLKLKKRDADEFDEKKHPRGEGGRWVNIRKKLTDEAGATEHDVRRLAAKDKK